MNDEIREAIMQFQTAIDFKEAPMPMNYSIDLENAKILLDYITNLQQENERLKEENSLIQSDIHNAYSWLEDYKSRCEKAIEYIGNNTHYYSTAKHGEGFVIDNENEEEFCNDLLNILQNGSEK